jgi:dTDP-4-amino-4,6-dideoxygalactose transaminase
MGFNKGDFPNAEKYYSHALSLPLYSRMNYEQQNIVIEHLEKILSGD